MNRREDSVTCRCYYDTDECEGELWQCQTCEEWFCQYHWHQTSRGRDVECAACEYVRKLDEEIYDDREEFRYHIARRQEVNGVTLCAVCAKGTYGDLDIDESIIKRSDLPGDNRIFVPINCCGIHRACHENTRQKDDATRAYLVSHYGIQVVADWLESLGMVRYPGRVQSILRQAGRL